MAPSSRNQSRNRTQNQTVVDAPSSAAAIVGIRELRADVAALVRRAGSGEQVIISVAGRPIAHLGPLRSLDGQIRLEDMFASGQVVAPRRSGSYAPPEPVPVWQGSRIDRLLHEIR